MSVRFLDLTLYGGFSCAWSDGGAVEVRGNKHRALLTILALAKNGSQSRAWLQETLWHFSGEEHGRASLRRALSDLKKIFGAEFDSLFDNSSADVKLCLDRVRILGSPSDGPLLDGITLPEPKFQQWLEDTRAHLGSRAMGVLEAGRGMTPRIAVMPFLGRGLRPELSRSGDWLACELTRTLSRSYLVEVVSHLSSRQMDSTLIDVKATQATLNVDYIVSGTFTCVGDDISLQIDLTETASGRLVCSHDIETRASDIIAGSNEAFQSLGSRIGYAIFSTSIELAKGRALVDVENHSLLMSAIGLMHQHRLDGFGRARVYLRELITRDPKLGVLYAWLAKWHVLAVSQGWSSDPVSDFSKATNNADMALNLTPDCAFSLAITGMIRGGAVSVKGSAAQLFEHSLEIDPNNSLAWLLYSRLHMFAGNGSAALKFADRACNLSPLDPYRYFYDIIRASAYSVCGDNEKALELSESAIAANPRHTSSHRVRTIALQLLDRGDEARKSAELLQKLEPNLRVSDYVKNHPAGDCALVRDWSRALRQAGIKQY